MIKTKKWDKIFLGEIADEITERVDKPSQSGFEMFVGLEHFVSGDLKIKQWGSTKNLVSAMKKFQKGDILFARRNAYLKRSSIVEFDGVCSGDAFVIREKKDRLVPGFLAFIFNSESLWNYANSYAAGTMSKRVKWRDLAKYSFKLPPLNEQKRLADLLWSVDETIEGWIKVLNQTEILIQSLFKEKLKSYHVSEVKVKEILEKNSKFKVGKVPQTEYLNEGKYPIINQSKTWIAGYSNNEELVYVGELPVLVFGDHTTEIKYVDFPFILGADGTKVVYPKPNIRARYLFYTIIDLKLKPVGYRRHFAILKDRKIKVPDLDKQDECIEELDYLFNKRALQEHNILNLKNIQKQIINQIFGRKS